VAARESGEHKLAGIGMARMRCNLGAVLDGLDDLAHARKIELRVDALRVQFIANVTRSMLPVRSPLPSNVPSTRSAPASTPSSARGHTAPAIVVRVQADAEVLAMGHVLAHVLNHVRVHVRGAHLDSGRKIDHHGLAVASTAARDDLGVSILAGELHGTELDFAIEVVRCGEPGLAAAARPGRGDQSSGHCSR